MSDEELIKLAKDILSDFEFMSTKCAYLDQGDCGHPDIEINCMSCSHCVCPLLLEALEE